MSEPVRIDSRKFLSALNDSAQSKVAAFEDRVQQMGKSAGKSWRLAALHSKQLYIEDTNSHQFLIAEHTREAHGKITISNIRPLEIVEEEKQSLFTETCEKLISAIEENNQKGMQVAFDRMKAQRFSGRAIPCSGAVRCRDNVLRYINIQPTNVSLEESIRSKLISVIVESLRDRVIVENGAVLSGTFSDGDPVTLPVTKWASRKLIAKRMMESAKNAYWSVGFQDRIYNVVAMIAEGKINDAVKYITPFLEEMEEFTLLKKSQVQTLIENTLASKAVFNQQLCDDTATLFFRTNMKLNRRKIIDEWKNIAKKSEHATLVENVQILENSKNFESAYQKFLGLVFETISNRDVAAEALATTLSALREKTPKIRESHDLSSKLNNLISRLKDKNLDDSAIYEAEDLIATIQEELAAADTLQNFDQIPPDQNSLDSDTDSLDSKGTPVININSPLIQIGGTSGSKPEENSVEDLPNPTGGDEDLDALLGADTQAPAPNNPQQPNQGTPNVGQNPQNAGALPQNTQAFESTNKGSSISESIDSESGSLDNSNNDPYAIGDNEKINLSENIRLTDYGAPVITDDGDIYKIIHIMRRLATENRLVGKTLEHNLPSMAKASIKALGIKIPESKLSKATEQIVNCFLESETPFPGAAPLFKKKSESDDDSESDSDDESLDSQKPWEDEGVAEDQYHYPKTPSRGYGRSSLGRTTSESIVWSQKQEDAILGECAGVRFIFDHGGSNDLPPVILSEDGSVEIPVPKELYESAFAAAKMSEGDPSMFTQWINESIEQLRPVTDDEDIALNEAIAKITAGPDGSISVEVSDDVGVGEISNSDDDIENNVDSELDNDEMIIDNDSDDMGDSDDMSPVDSINVDGVDNNSGDDAEDNEMPDFEKDDSIASGQIGDANSDDANEENPDVGEDEGFVEDKDVTSPDKSKYSKHVDDNLRDIPAHKVPKPTDDKLEGIGPDVKEDDGTGTKPPTAKKGD